MRSQILSRHLRVIDEERVDYPEGAVRPRTRADCLEGGPNAQRPCPWISCRHHLFVDVTKSGSVSLPWRERDFDELEETCSLDVALRGGMTLEDVGALMNVTRERTRQLEEATMAKLASNPMTKFLIGAARVSEEAVTAVRRRPTEEDEQATPAVEHEFEEDEPVTDEGDAFALQTFEGEGAALSAHG